MGMEPAHQILVGEIERAFGVLLHAPVQGLHPDRAGAALVLVALHISHQHLF